MKIMDFDILVEKISPRLKITAKRYSSRNILAGEDDLYQEMCIYLWNNYGNGVPFGINDAYIIKGCEFHILNFLRTKREKALLVSLEEPINQEGDTIEEILPASDESHEKKVDRELVFDKIRNNGFTGNEKNVLELLLRGCTMREAAKELGISHVMVLKYKKKIIKKWHKKGYQS